jgi:hypothetical protein
VAGVKVVAEEIELRFCDVGEERSCRTNVKRKAVAWCCCSREERRVTSGLGDAESGESDKGEGKAKEEQDAMMKFRGQHSIVCWINYPFYTGLGNSLDAEPQVKSGVYRGLTQRLDLQGGLQIYRPAYKFTGWQLPSHINKKSVTN